MADPITTLNATDSLSGASRADLNTNFEHRRWFHITSSGTTPYTIADADGIELLNYTAAAASVVNLPKCAAANEGREIVVYAASASSANTITVTPNSSDTVGGAATQVLNGSDEYIVLVSDGTSNWILLGDNR